MKLEVKENHAATKPQSLVRGKVVRNEVERQSEAEIEIQNLANIIVYSHI